MRYVLLLILSLVIPVTFYGRSLIPVCEEETQVYIDPSQVILSSQSILAFIGGEWLAVDAIYSVSGGMVAAIKKNPQIDRWRCSYCGFNNNSWDDMCQNLLGNKICGRPRPW